MKIAINRCWGGFGLSDAALERYNELSGNSDICYWEIERNDPILIQVIEEMGKLANGNYSELKVVEIPDDIDWFIDDYDGMETIHEKHRAWS